MTWAKVFPFDAVIRASALQPALRGLAQASAKRA
jgi:hypothetical protein